MRLAVSVHTVTDTVTGEGFVLVVVLVLDNHPRYETLSRTKDENDRRNTTRRLRVGILE